MPFTATCGVLYHLPPFVAVAVASSMRPPSATAPSVAPPVLSFVHCTAMCVRPVEGRPMDCV